MTEQNKVYLSLGSNIEPRLQYLNKALELIEQNIIYVIWDFQGDPGHEYYERFYEIQLVLDILQKKEINHIFNLELVDFMLLNKNDLSKEEIKESIFDFFKI